MRPTCAASSRSARSGRWRWASNCSPRFAVRRRPRRHTRPLCTKSSVPSAAPLCNAWETPQGPEPQPATGPAATTTGHTQGRRRHSGREIISSRQRTRRWTSHQRLRSRPSTATTPGEPTLPKRTPSYNPTTRGRATHSSNACRSGTPAGKTSTCQARATDTQRVEASLDSPWCRTQTKLQRLPPTSPGRGPRFPDPRNPPATEEGAAPNSDPSFHLTLLSREPDPQGAGPRGQANTRDPRPG